MRKKIRILLVVLLILAITYIAIRENSKGKTVIPDDYVQSTEAQAEMESRKVRFEGKPSASIIFSLDEGEGFETAYFPLTTKSDNTKYTKAKKAENKARIKALINAYDKFVSEAAIIHKVPRIVIYGLMAVEHDDTVDVHTSAKKTDSSGVYVGLMQMAVVTANDTLARGVTNKQLSPKQVEFFKQKIGKVVDSITKKDLMDAEINIHAAAAFLSVLIRKFGLDDLHKVIFCYNRGEFRLSKDKKTSLSINELIDYYKNTVHKDGAEYVLKTLGVDGSFQILQELGVNE